MFSSEPLRVALRRVASVDEWEDFSSLTVTRQLLEWNGKLLKPDPTSPATRYMQLLTILEKRALAKLQSGEWVAEGVSPHHGMQRLAIDQELWHLLEIEPLTYSAWADGFQFAGITVSQVKPDSCEPIPNDPIKAASRDREPPGAAHRQLAKFLRAKAESGSGPYTATALFEEASAVLPIAVSRYSFDQTITQMRRSGELPDSFFFKGRPKKS